MIVPAKATSNKQKLDSLENLLKKHPQQDTLRVNLLDKLCYITGDSAYEYTYKRIKEPLTIAHKINYQQGEAKTLMILGTVYFNDAKYKDALDNHMKSLSIARRNNLRDIESGTLYHIGQDYYAESQYDTALKYLVMAEKAYPGKDEVLHAKIYLIKGICYVQMNDLKTALIYFHKCMQIASAVGNLKIKTMAYGNIGAIYQNMNDLENAMMYYDSSLKINLKLNNLNEAGISYTNIGLVYQLLHKYNQSIDQFRKARAIFHTADNKVGESYVLYNTGNIFQELNEVDSAIRYVQYSIDMDKKYNLSSYISQKYHLIGKIYESHGDYQKALKITDSASKLAFREKNLGSITDIQEQISELLEKLHRPDEAFAAYKKFVVYKDSFRNENVKNDIERKQMKFDYDTKETATKAEQDKKNAVAAAELKSSRFQRNIFIFGGIIIAIIAIFLLVILRRVNKLNKEVTAEKEKSEQLGIVKDKLFSIISHDLRSPLASLDATTKLLRNSKMDPETTNELLNNLDVSLAATINLMDGLLMWSLSQMKNMELKPVETNLKAVAAENIAMYKETAKNKGIKLNNNVDDSINLMVDMHMMQIVARNLISNAIKYSYEGGEVLISTKKENNEVIFSVKDNGMGLVSEQIRNILETGARVNSKTGTGEEKGTGIGLAICNEILKKSGGYMTIDSVPEKGTTVSLHFPSKLIF